MQEKRRNMDPEDEPPEKENRVSLNAVGEFDGDLYSGGKSKFEGYHTSLAVDDQEEDEEPVLGGGGRRQQITAPLSLLNEASSKDNDFDPFEAHKRPKIVDRENEYTRRRRDQILSPSRIDPFANGGATPDINSRGYSQIMREQNIKKDQADYERQMKEKAKDGTLKVSHEIHNTRAFVQNIKKCQEDVSKVANFQTNCIVGC